MNRSHTYSTLTASESVLGQITHTNTLFPHTASSSVYNRGFFFRTRLHAYLRLVWYEHKSQTRNLFLWTGTGSLSYDQNVFRIIQQTSLSSTTLARIDFFRRMPFDTVYHWPVSWCESHSRQCRKASRSTGESDRCSVDAKRFASSGRHQTLRYRPYFDRIERTQMVHCTQI